MHLNEYQEQASKTALYMKPLKSALKKQNILPLIYTALGLAGEAGEFVEKVKKLLRNKEGKLTQEQKEALIKELGDILWYLSESARQLGVSLEEVAKRNIQKLQDRADRGVLHSEGDER